jgi:hypothetical protein
VDEDFNDAGEQLAMYINQLIEEADDDGRPEEQGSAGSQQDQHARGEVKYWTHQLGVSREKLQATVEKVGNAAAAVRKELAH